MQQAGGDGINDYYSRLTFYLDGDTLLNGLLYYKVYHTRWDSTVHEMFPAPPTVQTSGPNYTYALREDSLDRFWKGHTAPAAPELLTDFRLAVGDTLPARCVVDSISTLFYNSVPLKRWWTTYSMWLHRGGVVEGVGDLGFVCSLGFESNTWTVCYSKDGLTLQLDTTADCSVWPAPVYHHQIALGVPQAGASSVCIYPNPATDRLVVQWPAAAVDELLLLNAQGAVVQRHAVAGATEAQLLLGACARGVYLVQLKRNGRVVEGRRVVKE